MNTFRIALIAVSLLFIAGCATTGESYTDEGTGNTPSTKVKSSAEGNLPESSELPEIEAYDDPEIPALDTQVDNGNLAEATELPEIEAYDEPEIPALDAPATE